MHLRSTYRPSVLDWGRIAWVVMPVNPRDCVEFEPFSPRVCEELKSVNPRDRVAFEPANPGDWDAFEPVNPLDWVTLFEPVSLRD